MVVEQAPSSQILRKLQSSCSDARASRHKGRSYIDRVLKLHEKLHGKVQTRVRHAERRDAGAKRQPASGELGPDTEAAFGRMREAAIADVAAASPTKGRG